VGHRDDNDLSAADWDEGRPGETETERLDRNWSDLLQELRVTQTGVQLLTGFLLTLPFQQRFTQLDSVSRDIYIATISSAVVATAALVAPVATHRLLFRRHARASMVSIGHRFAIVGLGTLALSVCGVVDVILTMVVSDVAGGIGAAIAAVLFLVTWLIVPLILRARLRA
jgi:Family of unknown function (DUF6328)